MYEVKPKAQLLERMRENERHMARLLAVGVALSVSWLASGLWLWRTGKPGWALLYVLAAATVDAFNLWMARKNRRYRNRRRAYEALPDYYSYELPEEATNAV